MEDMHHFMIELFVSGTILLGAGMLFVLLFRYIGLGAVLGYLVAGVIIGPHVLGFVSEAESILAFAEIGIVLLLFLVGLELSPKRLWQARADIFLLGPLQVILCGLALFGAVSFFYGSFTWQAALVIALPLALSSTAQVLPLLQSNGRLKTEYGAKSFSILLFQDISIVPLLAIVAALSRAPEQTGALSGWWLLLFGALAILALVLSGHYILSPLLKLIGKIAERELFIVAGLFTICASAALMQLIGLSAALGAFIAGVMLAESPYRHELEADIDPFRSLLLGLFFLAVGMLLDLDVLWSNPIKIILSAVALVVIKIAVIFAVGRFRGMSKQSSIVMALFLSQGGEFGFVLFAAAQNALLIEAEAASLFGAIITLSMASTPFLIIIAQKYIISRNKAATQVTEDEEIEQGCIIIVGHGRFGQNVAQIIKGAGYAVTLIDLKPDQIELSGQFGRKVFYGDGTRIELLRRAGADNAKAILYCTDDKEISAETLVPVRQTFPNVKIYVRSYDRRQVLGLMPDPEIKIFREMLGSAIAMAREAITDSGTSADMAENVIGEFRSRDAIRLEAQYTQNNMKAGSNHSLGASMSDHYDIGEEESDNG